MEFLEKLTYLDFFLKGLIAIILGCIIGYERESKRKPAGIKTHALICLGTCILTFLSLHFATLSKIADPARIAAQIVSGIGFIGAGTIFVSKQKVQGLTSAAAVWISASIGMLIGAGLIILSFIATSLVVSFFYFLSNTAELKKQSYSVNIEIIEWESLQEIAELTEQFKLDITHKSLERQDTVHLHLNYSATAVAQHLFTKKLFQLSGIGSILKI